MRSKLLLCLSVLLLFCCTKKNEYVVSHVELIQEELVEKKEVANEKNEEETNNGVDEEKVVNVSNKKEESIIHTPIKESTQKKEKSDNKVDITVQEEIKQHQHQFIEVTETVYHDEIGHYENQLIKEGWIEEIPVYETTSWMQCNQCGHKMNSGTDIDAHYKASFDCSGWTDYSNRVLVRTDVIQHEPEYESIYIVDQDAYSEEVIVGYQCARGERK